MPILIELIKIRIPLKLQMENSSVLVCSDVFRPLTSFNEHFGIENNARGIVWFLFYQKMCTLFKEILCLFLKRVVCFILNNLHFPMVEGIAFYALCKRVLIIPCKADNFCEFVGLPDEI